MFAKTAFAAILATVALLDSAAALGINCRGSGLCPRAGWDNQASVSVLQGLRDAMYGVNGTLVPDSTTYNNGEHIICVSQSQKITLTPGVSAGGSTGGPGPSGSASATFSVGLSGSIGNGGVCVFAQNTAAGLSLGDAKHLIDGLLEHGCSVCGSNPSTPGNNVKNGQLTVNYVANPFCVENCISGQGTASNSPTNPSAGHSRRWGKDGERMRA